jgi:transposase
MENKSVVSSVRSKVDRVALAERRKQAIGWYRKGKTQYWIAKHMGVSFEAVRKWADAYEARGMKGLESKGHPGPQAELGEKDRKKIRAAILKGPRAEGYATDLWTLERIAQLIKRIGKVSYHPGHVWKVVVALGFSCQKPERRAKERDEEAIKNWRIRSFPPVPVMGRKT